MQEVLRASTVAPSALFSREIVTTMFLQNALAGAQAKAVLRIDRGARPAACGIGSCDLAELRCPS